MNAKDELHEAIRKAAEENDSTELENFIKRAREDNNALIAILDELIPDAEPIDE